MVDIVERLRSLAAIDNCQASIDAAAEIERLREALKPFADAANRYDPIEGDDGFDAWDWSPTLGMLRRARAALTVALEEAARQFDGWDDIYGDNAAAAIRALIPDGGK